MEQLSPAQGPLTVLIGEAVGEHAQVDLCSDARRGVVWVRISSAGVEQQLYGISGGMKTLAAGAHFVAAGVIDPPGSIQGVELELLGHERYRARVCPNGWLLVLGPEAGGYEQRVTFTDRTGHRLESATLPPAAQSLDSGGTSYGPVSHA
jgi:hypothetical protein